MNLKCLVVLLCVVSVAVVALLGADAGARVSGDGAVDVLSLQAMVSKILDAASLGAANCAPVQAVNVLDLQRALAHALCPSSKRVPPAEKEDSKGCFFRAQSMTEWRLEASGQLPVSTLAGACLPLAVPQDLPIRNIRPPHMERYLFRLTANAPPVHV